MPSPEVLFTVRLDFLHPLRGAAAPPGPFGRGRLVLSLLAFLALRGSAPAAGSTPSRAELATAGARHWAFAPLAPTPLPRVRNLDRVRTPVDRFILARLEQDHVRPSMPASRQVALRRLSLDLIGLPPSPEEMDRWLNDQAPGAWERQVDRLLASPHFGERWGRHWLDLARYADTSGYQVDRERPWAWVYRDWVLDAVNEDLPFDEFTRLQIAGDLLAQRTPGMTPEQARSARVAAGFHRMTLKNHEDGADPLEDAARIGVDRVASTGLAWLGLTVGCAQCHDHKYDPLTQREFFQLYAFFEAAEEQDVEIGSGTTAYSFRERPTPPVTRIHTRGDFRRPGEAVTPAFPAALQRMASRDRASAAAGSRRLDRVDLADWLVTEVAPLTARVAVNQVWLHLFGRGLVATTEDFGLRGEVPSHPELLDWLASEFIRNGWHRKELIRWIVCSATYRQSSVERPDLVAADPANRRLARQNRLRLDAEILRDATLEVAGLLHHEVGGKSFRPVMPEDVKFLGSAGAWTWMDDAGPVLFRRSLYSFAQRTVPHPLLATFDQAGSSEVCTRRERSNTPLQSLTLLNHPLFVGAAETLGKSVRSNETAGLPGEVDQLFRRLLGRRPNSAERTRLLRLVREVERVQPGAGGRVLAQTLLNLDEFLNRE